MGRRENGRCILDETAFQAYLACSKNKRFHEFDEGETDRKLKKSLCMRIFTRI